jgi:hypothetical protein
VGSVGRESGQVRLRVVKHTDKETLLDHVHHYTPGKAWASPARADTFALRDASFFYSILLEVGRAAVTQR